VEDAAGFFLNGGDDALSRDVSNSDYEPVDHAALRISRSAKLAFGLTIAVGASDPA
jgi:hypothetical protein